MNAVDALGETALHRAAAAGQISACRVLITHGADVSLRSFQGHTAAEVASEPVQKILHGNREESNLFFVIIYSCISSSLLFLLTTTCL